MQTSMILATSLLFFALFSPVELFKFYHKATPEPIAPPPPPPQSDTLDSERLYSPLYLGAPRYYPLPAELLHQQQQPLALAEEQRQLPAGTKGAELQATKGVSFGAAATKGLQQPTSFVQQPPASVAYLVVRPIQPAPYQQALYESNYRANYLLQQQQQQLQQLQQQPLRAREPAAIKGGRQTEEQTIQEIEQQHEITEHQAPVGQPALVVPVPAGKEGKLKAMLDKLMSKLTLGSSYQVTSEELVPPPQAPQPLAPQPQPQQFIQQQPIEQQQQQKLEQIEDQRLEQQLEQQRDNAYEEGTKQIKSQQEQQYQLQQQQQQLQQQQQFREEQLQQNLAEQELTRHRQQQQLAVKGLQQEPIRQEPIRQEPIIQEPIRQEPIRQELEPARQEAIKGKRVVQQQQLPLVQEPLRQEAKGGF